MNRPDALQAIYPSLQDCIVVTIMGAVSLELQAIGHRPNFFYIQHAMGVASSVGLGIAASRPDQTVVVLDGDGSLLMNLGTLTTLGNYKPHNLVHLVFDNESFVSIGGSPTFTAGDCDLAAIALDCGVPHSMTVSAEDSLTAEFDAALERHAMTTLVAKVETSGPPITDFVTDLGLLENRFQFQRHLRSL